MAPEGYVTRVCVVKVCVVNVCCDQFIHSIKVTASALSNHNLVTAKCNIPIRGNNMTTNYLNNSISFTQLNFFSDKFNWDDITTYLGSIAWQDILDNKPPDAM